MSTSHDIALPKPGSGPISAVFAALERRCTTREFSLEPLSRQTLSDLLWAAFGVNRPAGPFGGPGRTAGSASNSQEVDIYVALEEGAYRYDAVSNRLLHLSNQDLRHEALTPGQPRMSALAPVQLIYVADIHKLTHTQGFQEPRLQDPEMQKAYYYVDTGLIAGNVYLYAAAEGLAVWFHNCDREQLRRYLWLRADQHVLFAQSVGHPPR